MNTAQFLAADPQVSAWVAASAGTGKTKVLTDRILNLLLHGYAPERILCLTFTKAAAAEMANRLTGRLARWAIVSEVDLSRDVESLLGVVPSSPLLARARHLFPLVLDAAGGMKIQTIHGFCQSILGRFPLEAGIPPHFRVLDEGQAEELLLEAQQSIFAKPSADIPSALAILNPFMGDNRFTTILKDFYASRSRVLGILNQRPDFWDYGTDLLDFLEVGSLVENPQAILNPDLLDRLKAKVVPPGIEFEEYINAYLTQKGDIRKKLPPDRMDQAERVFSLNRSLSSLETAQRTLAFLILFKEILRDYQDQKNRRCALDYDDLIQQTQKLLTQPGVAAWVLYKLDGGIDHLLVDEAQDTNAAQWQIILNLTAEFFTPDKPYRTIFAVGDAKQSIYSFQGANPTDFLRLKTHFAKLAQGIGQDWREVQLDLSYRSTPAILSIVDEVFADDKTRQGVAFDDFDIVHHAFREHHPGIVELWPLIEGKDSDPVDQGWRLPLARVERLSPRSRLAQLLADKIALWIKSGDILPSTNQPIQPRDILILVRKRTSLVQEIIRALKKRGIPVAGSDRLILTDHIAVMDLLALGQFVLLPEDDLTLACLLRSPLIGLSEEDLFTLAHERENSLWASLSQKASQSPTPCFEKAFTWLQACLRQADFLPVYEFYSWVLTEQEGRRRFLSRLGNEVDEILEEFLDQAMLYDQDHASSCQGFIHFMSRQNQEIKRDASSCVLNQVRIMTVHGAKGLQAPIVILPDTSESGKGKWDPLLWGDNLVMLRPSQSHDTQGTQTLKNKGAEEAENEHRRLFYVALTRAQDRLYAGGWTEKTDLPEDCWYRLIEQALENASRSGIRINSQETNNNDQDNAAVFLVPGSWPLTPEHEALVLPPWASEKPIPSAPRQEKPERLAPQSSEAIERGILIHRFFEVLPDLPGNQRYLAACRILEKERLALQEWEADIQATLTIIDDPAFEEIFGSNSFPEVPVSGVIDGVSFQGRLDRLHVTHDTLTIIDYKTTRHPPTREEDIPDSYIQQLDGYAKALAPLYPHHRIRKLLVWTEGPFIHEIGLSPKG